MNNDTKIIWAAIMIIFVSMLSFKFTLSLNSITGQVVADSLAVASETEYGSKRNYSNYDSINQYNPSQVMYNISEDIYNKYSESVGEFMKEQVKCIFVDSNSEKECYSQINSCKGNNYCNIELSGRKGEQIVLKSTCGGYSYININGQNKSAEFKC